MADATPHETSLAVWAVPATVATGERFAIKVGAKSSAGCALGGHRVEVQDYSGAVLGSGSLGDTPWPDTGALFWTDIELAAPPAPGLHALSVRFDAKALDQPHRDAAASFDVAVVRPPQHTLTVSLVADGGPVEAALLRLGPYRAVTDAAGRAEVPLAKGRYQLAAWKAGYDIDPVPLEIASDLAVTVRAVAQPQDDPDAHWTA